MAESVEMIIRKVPLALRKSLKVRAAVEEKSMNALILEVLESAFPKKEKGATK